MRLSAVSPNFRTLLAVPFLAAMLAFPALAETKPGTPPDGPSAAQAESPAENAPPADAKPDEAGPSATTGESAGPSAATGDAKPEAAGPSAAATGDAKPEEAGPSAATGDAKPGGTDPGADTAVIEPPKSSILVNIDKSMQEMTVFVDGVELYTWPVSTGTRGYSTPSGTYTASSMNEIWYSKQWDNAPMPHAIFFTKKGHAIHGTLEEKNLGNAASHGCVRLSRTNAKTLFQLVRATGLENTQVVLTGTTKGGEGPKVASPGSRQYQGYLPPWFEPGNGYYAQPGQRNKKRRGLFGRRWFQPGAQGYYAPRYYPRGVGPRY
jgi:lipoprotein-anchoring transpeptidase ErfK/SrfK